MLSADLIEKVRAKCGQVTDTELLTDTNVTDEADNIIQIIAERLPQKAKRSITSVLNQRQYDTNAATKRVSIVFPAEDIDPNILDLGNEIATDEGDASEHYNFPSLWLIKTMRQTRGLPRIKHHFDPINKKLDIDPAPSEGGKTYYYISVEKADWTLANVPSDFEDMLLSGTTWRCLDIIMLKRIELGGVARIGDFVDYPAEKMVPAIERHKDDFFNELRIKEKLHTP